MRTDDKIAEVVPIRAGARGGDRRYAPHFVNLQRVVLSIERALGGKYLMLAESNGRTMVKSSPTLDDYEWALLRELQELVQGVRRVRLYIQSDETYFRFYTEAANGEEYVYSAQVHGESFEC